MRGVGVVNTWAIQNAKTGEFVYGTDYRYNSPNNTARQRTSNSELLTYCDREFAEHDIRCRRMSKDYRAVLVRFEIVNN